MAIYMDVATSTIGSADWLLASKGLVLTQFSDYRAVEPIPEATSAQSRKKMPFGENIREAIRIFKGESE